MACRSWSVSPGPFPTYARIASITTRHAGRPNWNKTIQTSRTGAATTVWRPRLEDIPITRQEQMWLVARANVAAFFHTDGRFRRPESLPPEIACTIVSITRRRSRDGREGVAVRLRDKVAAHQRLAIALGIVPRPRRRY